MLLGFAVAIAHYRARRRRNPRALVRVGLRAVRSTLVLLFVLLCVVGTSRTAVAEGDVEKRIADFWKRVDALRPVDLLAAADLGQWAMNVIERDATTRITVQDFRASTAAMQSAIERVRTSPPAMPAPGVEARIAEFWKRVDALRPVEHLASADLGQWALNVTARDVNARIAVADFRASTAAMQGAIERAGRAPATGPIPTPTPVVPPVFDPRSFIGRGDAFNCGDFASQAQAQAVLRADPADPNRLDGDRNGVACETNPMPRDLVPVTRPAQTPTPQPAATTTIRTCIE